MQRRLVPALLVLALMGSVSRADRWRDVQQQAAETGYSDWGYWGTNPDTYSSWTGHSNRLIPVYVYGGSLEPYRGAASVYRDRDRLARLYGREPEGTWNPAAEYFDQTDIYHLQRSAVEAGKRYVILIVFDGLDWPLTQVAASRKSARLAYDSGRGNGLSFLDYSGVDSDWGYFVTSPHSGDARVDVDGQAVVALGPLRGGYSAARGGATPWHVPPDAGYPTGRSRELPHAVTDSASAATSLACGIKTYNGAIGVDPDGRQVESIARRLQRERRFAVGLVTSVAISHATTASAYANNVEREDYQDVARDLLGLASAAHRHEPLPGVDVLLGAGWGEDVAAAAEQGANFVPGNKYITSADVARSSASTGGPYVVVERTPLKAGRPLLDAAAARAAESGARLFGMFGVAGGHLPYQTADGRFDPTRDRKEREAYTLGDVEENPTLADMTRAALSVLQTNPNGFWLMVEPGDVDWASHDNNVDNSIGAVLSGDDAFREVVRWVEAREAWDETLVIVTSDHGHLLTVKNADPPASQ